MDVEKHISYWVKAANSDLETADILIQGNTYFKETKELTTWIENRL